MGSRQHRSRGYTGDSHRSRRHCGWRGRVGALLSIWGNVERGSTRRRQVPVPLENIVVLRAKAGERSHRWRCRCDVSQANLVALAKEEVAEKLSHVCVVGLAVKPQAARVVEESRNLHGEAATERLNGRAHLHLAVTRNVARAKHAGQRGMSGRQHTDNHSKV